VRGFGLQSDRTKLPQKGDREKNILMSLAFLKELDKRRILLGALVINELVYWKARVRQIALKLQ
jgi:hypothetical protein